MQSHGMSASKSALESLSSELEETCESIRHRISKNYFNSKPINPNSPYDTRDLIKLNRIPVRGKKTPSGDISTAKDAIEYLRYTYPAIEDVFQFREHDHLRTSFCNPFLAEYSIITDPSCSSDIFPVHSVLRSISNRNPPLFILIPICSMFPPELLLAAVSDPVSSLLQDGH